VHPLQKNIHQPANICFLHGESTSGPIMDVSSVLAFQMVARSFLHLLMCLSDWACRYANQHSNWLCRLGQVLFW
jgi:hypothetical protein